MKKSSNIGKELDSKKKNKKLVDQAAERLAEILTTQIELNRNRKNRKEKTYDKEKI